MYVVPFAQQFTDSGTLTPSSPITVEGVKRAFQRIQRIGNTSPAASGPLGLGDFVGPNPRVTRDMQVAHLDPNMFLNHGDYLTRASWLYQMPDIDPSVSAVDRARLLSDRYSRLRDQLLVNLRAESPETDPGSVWTVQILGYDPAVNGAVTWWQSGAAATSPTYINSWPAALATPDNPVGPNDTSPFVGGVDLAPPLPTLPQVGSALMTGLKWLAIGAAVFYLGPPLLSWGARKAFSGGSEAPVRRLPSGKRRKRR